MRIGDVQDYIHVIRCASKAAGLLGKPLVEGIMVCKILRKLLLCFTTSCLLSMRAGA